MGVTEEIFRLRYETDLDNRIPRLQSLLKGVEDRMNRIRSAQERPVSATVWKQMERDAARYRAEIGRVEEAQRKAAYQRQQAFNRLGEGDAVRPSQPGVARGGGPGRGAALGRSAFALANIGQDVAAAGPGAALNNVLQPMLWDDLAKAIGGGRLALAGFGTAAVAVGAGFITVDRGLKNAGLGWGDFLDVVGNLAPIEAAGQAIDGIGLMLKDSGIVDFVDTFVGDVAQYTIGWRDATEAVRQHKEMLAETAGIEKAMASASAKFRSGEQREADAKGERFGQALAEMGGAGGLDAIRVKIGKGGQGLLSDAIGGDAHAQGRVMDLLGQMGMDTTGLGNAQLGPGVGLDEIANQVKEENALFEANQAEAEAKRAATNDHKRAVEREVAAATERAQAGAIADVPHAEARVIAGLNSRLGEGMGADQAAAEVAANLEKAIGDALPEEMRKAAADKFVGGELKELKEDAARDKLFGRGPVPLTMAEYDRMGGGPFGGSMAMFSQGPKTIAAGGFASTVQDSQKPIVDVIREGNELAKENRETLRKIADNTRANTLVGP